MLNPENETAAPSGIGNGGKENSTRTSILSGMTPQARWAAANPLAVWAHRCFEAALRKGLVDRKPCQVCGAEPADFHHHPQHYDQPLLGAFLCRKHHVAEHRRLKCEATNG
ncbi:hypothetical protein MesoLj113b_36280 [Mesorhizobium sp. 113-3-3]|nr:hypothetical protein MesoLj113b_36280 [Mesorhizobium sp. 113-3-3]